MARPNGNAVEGRPLLPNNNERSSYITFDAPNGAPTKHSKASTVSQAKRYLSANVSNDYTDFILIVCFAISGLIDSGA